MSKVHVVVPTYNGERYLKALLDSVIANDYNDFDIEICDDCSTDGTVAIAEEYVREYDNITLHKNKKNLGYTKNFLSAIKRSESPYIMLCDQDDIWHKNKIRVTAERMKKVEKKWPDQPVLVFTDAMNYDSDSKMELGSFFRNSHMDPRDSGLAKLLMENKVIGCTVMINRQVLDYLDVIPEGIKVHDWWLALICRCFGKISYIDNMTLHYRQHSGNMIGGASFGAYFVNRLVNIVKQRNAIRANVRQGKAFYNLFKDRLRDKDRYVLRHFARLYDINPIKRKYEIVKFGFKKSGIIRNLMLIIIA
ncbi:glycosyltransferase family 2 protein [Eubacterium xylanophilum]|uniref:glycosyltransferase family 2 protein n=1 Tax=Eubacterium xylanophilum TaxID=39497 RepID=UPI0004B7431C|nr:glycosyltransferase family 2 protein [Eubacterium xylanophilum]